MTVPAYASDASLPKPSLRFRNASATTVRLRLVEEDEATSLAPSFMKEAKATCVHCGYRAASRAGHPLGKISGLPICQLPPELRKAEL